MLLSAVSVLVVEQSSSEIPEGLMNNPVYSEDDSGIGYCAGQLCSNITHSNRPANTQHAEGSVPYIFARR